MGNFISDAWDDITGKSASNAAGNIGREQIAFQQKGLDEFIRQFGITQENFQPYLGAGSGALPDLERGATVEGMDSILAQLSNSDLFNTLRDERERSVTGLAAAGGNSRGGAGYEAIAEVPTDVLMALEQMLNSRQSNLVNLGQNTAVGAGNAGQNFATNVAGQYTNMGNARADSIAGQQAAGAMGTENIAKLLAGFFTGGIS